MSLQRLMEIELDLMGFYLRSVQDLLGWQKLTLINYSGIGIYVYINI